jgi:O-antigen/teichoic acid export membrane protein
MGLVVLGRSQFSLPFAMASMREYAEADRRDDVAMLRRSVRYWLTRSQGVAAALIFAVGVPYCLWRSVSLWLPVLTFALFVVDSEITVAAAYLNASKRHRSYSLLRGAEAWIRPGLAVALVYVLRPSASVVLVGYLLGGFLLAAIVAIPGLCGRTAPVGALDDQLTRRVWRFCLPLFPIAPVEWISSLSDRYLISGFINLNAAGIYAAAYGLISQPFLMAGIVLENYYRPHYYDALADKKCQDASRLFRTWFVQTAVVCAFGLIAVMLLKSVIVAVFLAPSYRTAESLLLPIALGNACFALSQVSERFLHGRNRTDLCLVSRTVGACMSLVAGIPMIYVYGLLGAAWAVPIYYGSQLACGMLIVYSLTRSPDIREVLTGENS